jgi:general secretion pathway protein G
MLTNICVRKARGRCRDLALKKRDGVEWYADTVGELKRALSLKSGRQYKMEKTNARKGGFTLVELLIVIMIIAILAGMMLLATGSAIDGAEATKVVNDLRNLKSAALLYYGDNMQWPTDADVKSLDRYTDRPITDGKRYKTVKIGAEYTDGNGISRTNIGVELDPNANGSNGVQKKLASKAADVGLLEKGDSDALYVSGSTEIWVKMR